VPRTSRCLSLPSQGSHLVLSDARIRAWLAFVGVILLAAGLAACSDEGPRCQPASSTALSTISDGARKDFAPLTLTSGQALEGTLFRSAVGTQEHAMFVAAQTPAGVGVWVMITPTYEGQSGVVFSVERVSMLTTSWGTVDNPDASIVRTVQACVTGSSPA
jgi:hypothetical protein